MQPPTSKVVPPVKTGDPQILSPRTADEIGNSVTVTGATSAPDGTQVTVTVTVNGSSYPCVGTVTEGYWECVVTMPTGTEGTATVTATLPSGGSDSVSGVGVTRFPAIIVEDMDTEGTFTPAAATAGKKHIRAWGKFNRSGGEQYAIVAHLETRNGTVVDTQSDLKPGGNSWKVKFKPSDPGIYVIRAVITRNVSGNATQRLGRKFKWS